MITDLTADQEETVRQTYYGLRLAMVVLAAMLYVAIALLYFQASCSQSSISAYYYTPVRPVFIAALGAIGVGLIIYRGNTRLENQLLDIAGFAALIVAFVPTGVPTPTPGTSCNTREELLNQDIAGTIGADLTQKIELAYTAKLADSITTAVANNVVALFAAGLLAIVLSRFLKPRFVAADQLLTPDRWRSISVSLLLLVAGTAFYFVDREQFLSIAHGGAAIIFFLLILSVMVLNGLGARTPTYQRLYMGTAAATVLLMIVVFLLRNLFDVIFWLETVGIAGFTAFWVVQTNELGGFINRQATPESGS